MVPENCAGRTILIIERDIPTALALQDRIEAIGGRVLTAYSEERALQLAAHAAVSDAVIDVGFRGFNQIVQLLEGRRIPYLSNAGHGSNA